MDVTLQGPGRSYRTHGKIFILSAWLCIINGMPKMPHLCVPFFFHLFLTVSRWCAPPSPPTGLFQTRPLKQRACNGIYGDSPEWRRISANGDDDGNCFISSATRALILSRLMKRNYYQGTLTSVRLWSFFIGISVWIFGQKSIYLIIGNYFIFLNWS